MPPFAIGVALIRRSPFGRSGSRSATGRPSRSKSSSGRYERSHASSIARCSGFSRTPASGTWCARKVPSTCTPSTTRGPVQPLGVRSTMAGHRGADSSNAPAAASARIEAMRS